MLEGDLAPCVRFTRPALISSQPELPHRLVYAAGDARDNAVVLWDASMPGKHSLWNPVTPVYIAIIAPASMMHCPAAGLLWSAA